MHLHFQIHLRRRDPLTKERTECFYWENLGTSRVHSFSWESSRYHYNLTLCTKSAHSVQKGAVLHGCPALKMAKIRRIRPLPNVTPFPCCPSLVNTLFSLDLALYPACCVLCCPTKLGRRVPPPLFPPTPAPPTHFFPAQSSILH